MKLALNVKEKARKAMMLRRLNVSSGIRVRSFTDREKLSSSRFFADVK